MFRKEEETSLVQKWVLAPSGRAERAPAANQPLNPSFLFYLIEGSEMFYSDANYLGLKVWIPDLIFLDNRNQICK